MLIIVLAWLGLAVQSAPDAWGIIARVEGGAVVSYMPMGGSVGVSPFDLFFTNLDYNGGPVMASNTNYALYWDPAAGPSYPPDYRPGVNRFFKDLAHDSAATTNVDSVASQYNDAAGGFATYASHFAGAILDGDPYPPNGCRWAPICLSGEQIRAELGSFIESHRLPHDLGHEYFLLRPPAVEDCLRVPGGEFCSGGAVRHQAYCAYHSYIAMSGGPLIFSNNPYLSEGGPCAKTNRPNGSTSDGVVSSISHEHNESITDPEPPHSWRDFSGFQGEIADKCRTFEAQTEYGPPLGIAPNGAKYNQVINGHLYWLQQEWSNQSHQCLQRHTFTGEEPAASFTAKPGVGTQASFDASSSRAPGGVARYSWQFGDGTLETTTATVSHAFLKEGTHLVALTVFAADGTSNGTARDVTVGAPKVIRIAPASGPLGGGTTVSITGRNLDEVEGVTFGAAAARSFAFAAPNTVTAVSPPGAPGVVDVRVRTPVGTSALSLGDRFRYR